VNIFRRVAIFGVGLHRLSADDRSDTQEHSMKVDYIRRRGGDLAVLEPEIAMVAQVQSRDSFVISRKHSRNHEADFIPCCLNSSAFYLEELLHLGAHKGGNCLNLMQGRTKLQFIYSKETMCLGCHLVVRMFHERDDDPRKGAWQCPACGRRYPFLYWKIRKHLPKKPAAA